ncbi:MAG: protein-L-isoaspartate(D-aspartate) O-methyltransferase [Candidatus Izemoplasmataceae bacterium]|jgi:protein-L-isoaspartate(D-aspartate) O-methyltransferase|uniref:protein-L-isoaspartate(D-aspartate) O-methyltransferase n=1 Tax=Liberiplasma polymorphum TaxID=3374570 RepID=UPI003774012E
MSEDTFKKLRDEMVYNQIKARSVQSKEVIEAFKTVPRHEFVPKEYAKYAYHDHPLDIGHNQTISQPYIVAYMVEALQLSKSDRVLEIGTGSGYQTAILSLLASEVVTIERINDLQTSAMAKLNELNYKNIIYRHGDGSKGALKDGPFDAIVVSAAAKKVPEALIDQLKEDGRLVIPIGGYFYQELTLLTKKEGKIKETPLGGCRFVPLISKEEFEY